MERRSQSWNRTSCKRLKSIINHMWIIKVLRLQKCGRGFLYPCLKFKRLQLFSHLSGWKMSFSNKADILTQWMMFSARYWQPRRSIIYSSNQIAQNIRGPPTPKCKRSFLWEYYPYKLEVVSILLFYLLYRLLTIWFLTEWVQYKRL